MAIGKAAKWISFTTPQHTPSSPISSQSTLDPTLAIADEKQFGLENFGNTCYANSVLQALYFCSPFRDLVIQSTDISAPPVPRSVPRPTHPPTPATTTTIPRRKSERGKLIPDHPSAPTSPPPVIPSAPPTLFSALRSLYVYISRNPGDKGTVAPRAFIDKLRDCNELFRGAMHQDAHEFHNYLLNRIVDEIQYDKHHKDKDVSPSNGSGEDLSSSAATLISNNPPTLTVHSDSSQQSGTLVHRLFEGTLTSETRCLTCETVSSRDESFLDLSIDIEQNSSVTACLRQFSASEMLCQRNKFFCDSCCGLQEAEKRMKIKKLPNILALHLKRFKYQEELRKYIKLTYRVAFPFELRLFNTVDEVDDPDRLYELFGIVVHIGSGPHHGHYVAIVKGPHTWLLFDDDKIEPVKESEIPRYFGDGISGSAYVLYYQAVDLDHASLGLKLPATPAVSDFAVAGTPANATRPESNGGAASDFPEPALPPGLGDSHVPTPAPATPPPPIPTTPSSSSLVSPPLVPSETLQLPSRKKSLPTIRIPGTSDTTTTSPTTPNRTHGGLFQSLRSSPGSSRIRPSTAEGAIPSRSPVEPAPPVPPVPSLYINGKELAVEKEREKEKENERESENERGEDRETQREREREEGRSSKEFDRRPSMWFKRWSTKSPKDEREKERDKDKTKEKDVGQVPVPAITATPSQATTSTVALSSAPSQSDAGSSASGASSVWRRGSARLGYHAKRPSATYSSTTLGELDAAGSQPVPGSAASPHPHPHNTHHRRRSPPPPLPAVPPTPQGSYSNAESSSPSTSVSASGPPHSPAPTVPAHHPPPLASTSDALSPPSTSDAPPSTPDASDYDEDDDHEDHDDDRGNDDGDDYADEHHNQQPWRRHRWARPRAPAALLAGRRRPHSMHGSGSGTPRERSASSHAHVEPSLQSASAAEGDAGAALAPLANGAPPPLSSSLSVGKGKDKNRDKDKEPGLRRAARKLSLNAPMFGLGLGLGLGGREKDRERDTGKKDDGKKAHKMGTPSTALSSSSAALASAAR